MESHKILEKICTMQSESKVEKSPLLMTEQKKYTSKAVN